MFKFFPDSFGYRKCIFNTGCCNEFFSICFYSWKIVQVLDKMFAYFHTPFFFSFGFDKFDSMKFHNLKQFLECGYIFSRQKTPWISKTSSSNHKSIEIFHLFYPIIIIHNISITDKGNMDMIFKFINICKVGMSCVGLFCCSSMNSQKATTCIF